MVRLDFLLIVLTDPLEFFFINLSRFTKRYSGFIRKVHIGELKKVSLFKAIPCVYTAVQLIDSIYEGEKKKK